MPLDVTDQVKFGNNDDECVPLHQCVCGKTFSGWDAIVSIYENAAWQCDECGRQLYFRNSIRIFQVTE